MCTPIRQIDPADLASNQPVELERGRKRERAHLLVSTGPKLSFVRFLEAFESNDWIQVIYQPFNTPVLKLLTRVTHSSYCCA